MKITPALIVLTTAIGTQAQAQSKPQQQHAHDHSAAKLNIAVEGNTATLELEAAAQAIVGFERKPKDATEQKKVDAALASLKSRIGQILILPADLGCRFNPTKAELHLDGSHAEVHAEFSVQCSKPLKGAEVRFGITKAYPAIEEVRVQAISETGQTGATIRQDKGSVKIG
jgi:hypothetical protein